MARRVTAAEVVLVRPARMHGRSGARGPDRGRTAPASHPTVSRAVPLRLADHRAVAAPSPSARVPTQACSHRVERDVPDKLEKVVGALDEVAVETTLEEMSRKAVADVEPLCVPPVQPLHAGRDVGLRRLDHEVEVIGHQAVGVTPPSEPADCGSQQLEKAHVVDLVAEDRLLPVAARDDVIDAAGKLKAKRSRHGAERRSAPGPVVSRVRFSTHFRLALGTWPGV